MCGYVAMYLFENNGLGEPDDRRLKTLEITFTLKIPAHFRK